MSEGYERPIEELEGESTAQENLEAATQTLRELQAATKAAAKVVKKLAQEAQKDE